MSNQNDIHSPAGTEFLNNVRAALDNKKTRKSEFVTFALALGIVKSKSEGDKLLIAALRGNLSMRLAEIDKERAKARALGTARETAQVEQQPQHRARTDEKRFSSNAMTRGDEVAAQERRRKRNQRKHKRARARTRHSNASGYLPRRAA